MRIKLDENLGDRGADILRKADVATVVEQGLVSVSDDSLIEICRAERRSLVTLDLDFSNPLRFDPTRYPGVAVLRPHHPGTPHPWCSTASLLQDFWNSTALSLYGLASMAIEGKLSDSAA